MGGNKLYDFFTHDFNVKEVVQALKKAVPDQVFEPKPTQMTSTLIWLAFIRQNWPCGGGIEVETTWIPSSHAVSAKVFRNTDEFTTKPCLFLLVLLVLPVAMMMYASLVAQHTHQLTLVFVVQVKALF